MNLERTKPETLAAGVMDYMPQSLAAHDYAERLNAALARLGLTERLTLPSAPATAIDELPAVVDVPLRKTLSVLMGKAQQGDASALATLEMAAQVMESIFAGLHARDFAGDRPLALPSHESLATLSQGVDALLPRKISNGAWSLLADGTPSDGIQDGTSLVRLLCSSAADSVTELKDDNEGWVMTKALPWNTFPNVTKATLGMESVTNIVIANLATIAELDLPNLKEVISIGNKGGTGWGFIQGIAIERLVLPNLERYDTPNNHSSSYEGFVYNCANLKEFIAPKLSYIRPLPNYTDNAMLSKCGALEKIVVGKLVMLTNYNYTSGADSFINTDCPNLIHFEIGEGSACSIRLTKWNPTSVLSDSERLPIFLSNFKTYIAERLSEQGSGKTLTLSQAVRDAIEGDPTIAQIITSKGWTISPAPSV